MKIILILTILLSSCGKHPKTETYYIPGPIGKPGMDGRNTIIEIAPATTCPTTGVTLLFALDNNYNEIIDLTDSNIRSATICDGLTGPQGEIGLPGVDAVLSGATPVEIINPCGNYDGFDEILLKLANGQILSSFSQNSSGLNTRFAILHNGSYVTTDNDHCSFSILNGQIINESHH